MPLVRWMDRMNGARAWPFVLLGVLFVSGISGWAHRLDAKPENDAAVGSEASDAEAAPAHIYREGTQLHQVLGQFRKIDDRMAFYLEDGHQFTMLENLTLERVARTIGDTNIGLRWSISGSAHEFQGESYLMLTSAVVKANLRPNAKKPPAPSPEAVDSAQE